MKRKFSLFIFFQTACFFTIWSSGNVRGQPVKRGKVSDLIKKFENPSNVSNLYPDSIVERSFERGYEDREQLLSRKKKTSYDQQQPSTSYGNAGRKFYSKDVIPSNEQRSTQGGNDYNYDNTDDDDDDDDSDDYGYTPDSIDNGSPSSSRDYNHSGSGDDSRDGNRGEGGRVGGRSAPYLGKSFDNFRKNLGLGMDDFSDDPELYDNPSGRSSPTSSSYDDAPIYDNFQFVKPKNLVGSNTDFYNTRDDRSQHAYDNKMLSSRNHIPTNEQEDENMYEYAYQINPIKDSENSNIYNYPIYNTSPSTSSQFRRSNEPLDVHVESEYSLPVDNKNFPVNQIMEERQNANSVPTIFREKTKSTEEIHKYNTLNSPNPNFDDNIFPGKSGYDPSKGIERKKSSKKGFFKSFRKNKNEEETTVGLGRHRDMPKQIYNSNEKKVQKEVNKLSNVEIFNIYQKNFFLKKILRSDSNPIKKFFQRNSASEKIISVTNEVQKAAQQCVIKNQGKLTKQVIMQQLAFNNQELLKKYEYTISYITFHHHSNKDTCLDIKPMIYKEDDRNIGNMLTSLPNIYILNTYEFILSNPAMCSSFKYVIKNKRRDNHFSPTDMVLLLSTSYFRTVNPTLVTYLMNFLRTKNEIYLKKYYLSIMMTFVPFIKPAMKIFFQDNYKNLNEYIINTEIQKIFNELLYISLEWTQAFKEKCTESTNKVILQMYKTLTSYSRNTNKSLSRKYKSLEMILHLQRMEKDLVNKKDDKLNVVINLIMKYMRNIYSTVHPQT
ncbi:conserved Plasmodium protein, unknown function [Plasmodium ovale]|uniref:Rhoptry-associated protein 1 n=1 Tax=Plasmodium ovale TaxID=36330 RepID=A0A1C3L5W5_PLAOA|nr:conserved Plasmodium protein, unknown function [Plasmodium ovale]